MNITQLKYFHAVAEYHTVSLAAQRLYISQPSLSNAIRELEREFALSLFYRRHNGMFLTPEGTKLYNSTKELLTKYAEVERVMLELGGDTRRLRLGIPPMLSSIIFADIYREFAEKNGHTHLEISEKGKYELLSELNDGLLDTVLLPHVKPFDISYRAQKVGRLEVVCWVNKLDSLAEREEINAKMLEGKPLVLFADTFFQTKTIREWFSSAGAYPTVCVQTEQLSTAESMIESGQAIGFTFGKIANKNRKLRGVSLFPRIFVDVSLVRSKDVFLLDGVKELEKYFKNSNPFDK